jgi:hypothetical protein
VLTFKQYLASKSHAALHEAFRNEIPGKTKQQVTTKGEIHLPAVHKYIKPEGSSV